MNAQIQTLPAVQPSASESAFNLAQRQAKALAQSDLVPQAYRNNLPNTMLAMEIANRIGASPFLVMQHLYIVQGKPSWSSSFLIATVNACGRFSPIRFEVIGEDASDKAYKVRAYAMDKESGERCDGPFITWKMVDGEGWSKKSGSKWVTLPDLMFRYRAAGFWTRLYAPEVSMGILMREEAEDVWVAASVVPSAPTDTGNLKALEADLRGEPAPIEHRDDMPTVDPQALHDRLLTAEDIDALNDAAADIGLVEDAEAKASLTAFYAERGEALSE